MRGRAKSGRTKRGDRPVSGMAEGYGGLEGAAEGKEKTGTEAAKAEGRERGPVGERAERSFSPCRRQEKRTGRGQPPDLRASYENLPDDPGSHSGGTGAAGKRAGI